MARYINPMVTSSGQHMDAVDLNVNLLESIVTKNLAHGIIIMSEILESSLFSDDRERCLPLTWLGWPRPQENLTLIFKL